MSETPTKEQLDKMKANARDFAVWAVDGVHGYTCEHSSDPQGHVDEYARHEADFLAVIDMAIGFLAMQPRPLRNLIGRVAVIESLDRDTDEPFHIIVHKYPDGKWREAGAHLSCGHFNENKIATPLSSLQETKK